MKNLVGKTIKSIEPLGEPSFEGILITFTDGTTYTVGMAQGEDWGRNDEGEYSFTSYSFIEYVE